MSDAHHHGEKAPLLTGVKMLWSSGYYDGPLDGMCLYADRLHWFTLPLAQRQAWLEDGRVFDVYALTDEDARTLVTQHFLFEQHVGTHTCSHAGLGHGAGGVVFPLERHAAFYAAGHERFTPTEDHEPIGRWDFYGVLADPTPSGSCEVPGG